MPTTIQTLNRTYRRAYWRLAVGIPIFCAIALVAALSLVAINNPKVASWISESAQAEYVGNLPLPAPETARLAMPNEPVRQARAN